MEFQIGSAEAGKKLHRWLRQQLPGVPLSGVYKLIRTGRVRCNGKKGKMESVLQEGDRIVLSMADEDYAQVKKKSRPLDLNLPKVDVIYESQDLLVVNKPAGVLVHDTHTERHHTLTQQVLTYLAKTRQIEVHGRFQPGPANRLDRNTSGLVIFTKNIRTAQMVAEALKWHHLRKWYLALVLGETEKFGVLTESLQRDPDGRRTRVTESGKTAATSFIRRETTGKTSVVQVEIMSGRTHQIRAHFANIGHPLLGDVKYGGGGIHEEKSRLPYRGPDDGGLHGMVNPQVASHQWLHAAWLQLPSGEIVHAPLPVDFERVLRESGYSADGVQALEELVLPFADEWD